MDWFVDASDVDAVGELRHELAAYLRRHGEATSDFHGAELAFSELLTNAVVHTNSSAWVSIEWGGRKPLVTVHDLGPGFIPDARLPDDPFSVGGRGLFMAAHVTEELAVAAKRAGGSKVSAVLPVTRPSERSYSAVPRPRSRSLPLREEASSDGTFEREAFLRALIVQLALAVEEREGPDSIEELITQVGTDVGSRMETEYRRAREIVGRLTPQQVADLYIRLKAAIGGDFYVIEADDTKIVLGNRRCPFGDAVQRSPGLCRMTSSVFGGIAARNHGEAAVVLEERIAVGDPECRVVVWLQAAPPEQRAVAHRYVAPGEVEFEARRAAVPVQRA